MGGGARAAEATPGAPSRRRAARVHEEWRPGRGVEPRDRGHRALALRAGRGGLVAVALPVRSAHACGAGPLRRRRGGMARRVEAARPVAAGPGPRHPVERGQGRGHAVDRPPAGHGRVVGGLRPRRSAPAPATGGRPHREVRRDPLVRWQARWIWDQRHDAEGAPWSGMRAPEAAVNAFVMLRREFEWSGAAPVVARVTADSRYVLWVNGHEVSRGPARSMPAHLPVELIDLTPYLFEGPNCVAALCRYYGEANCWWLPVGPVGRLGMGSFLLQAAGPGFELITDASWKAMPAPYRRDVP